MVIMMIILTIVLFGLVVLITHFLEGITGFGCTVLALPFCIALVGIKTAVPTLVILAWILSLYIAIIAFKDIVLKELEKILCFVGLGLPVGMILFSYLPEGILKKILAVFMIFVSIRGLYVSFKKTSISSINQVNQLNKHTNYLLSFILFLGGIIHGAFGSGGPFVVIYATKALPKKNNFRATLCALWFVLNSIIITKNTVSGVINGEVVKLLLCTLPFLVVGMLLGNIAHHKIKDTIFTKIVYAVLLLSGVFMLF